VQHLRRDERLQLVEVSELRIHPIKSLRGISVQASQLEPRGLAHDRRMMLVDADGRFISQREHAPLALVGVQPTDKGWSVTAPGHEALGIGNVGTGKALNVTVWRDTVSAERVSDMADAWFSNVLGFPARLVRMTDESSRPLHEDFAREGDQVSFADAMPVLVASEASLGELNSRVGRELEMRRFRANIIIRGCEPHAEDGWREIRIGETVLRSTKRCGRCIVTTIDPETGVAGTEPLKALAGYRLFDQNACFGMYYAPVQCGSVRVGDRVLAK